ncbi:hypothetical protein Dda_3580 [Drechslerella dactyloides]|uniref:Uncharacterized protein n=1 Tax=Drechslerella dactyloides TaxID=74499 RepID=A0AAD6NJP8_DREDA|nr:hypothetical protein Dda_3580 [Drechslerella dactyloides]
MRLEGDTAPTEPWLSRANNGRGDSYVRGSRKVGDAKALASNLEMCRVGLERAVGVSPAAIFGHILAGQG